MTFEMSWWNPLQERVLEGTIVNIRSVRCIPHYDIQRSDGTKVTLPTHSFLLQPLIENEITRGDKILVVYLGKAPGKTRPYNVYSIKIWNGRKVKVDNKEKVNSIKLQEGLEGADVSN